MQQQGEGEERDEGGSHPTSICGQAAVTVYLSAVGSLLLLARTLCMFYSQ